MKKSDLIFVITPFVLTAVLIIVGYKILVAQTPEASASLVPQQESLVEILENGDIQRQPINVPIPQSIKAVIVTVPENRQQLSQIINNAQGKEANSIYLTVPITIDSDSTLKLTNQDASSQENITRWIKTTINQAHANNLHVFLVLNLNASQALTQLEPFQANYFSMIDKWAGLATEFGVTFFSPGITLSHPLYAQWDSATFNQLLLNTERRVRQKFTGLLTLNICCTLVPPTFLAGFNVATIIPTPEFSYDNMEPVTQSLAKSNKFRFMLLYERDTMTVTSR